MAAHGSSVQLWHKFIQWQLGEFSTFSLPAVRQTYGDSIEVSLECLNSVGLQLLAGQVLPSSSLLCGRPVATAYRSFQMTFEVRFSAMRLPTVGHLCEDSTEAKSVCSYSLALTKDQAVVRCLTQVSCQILISYHRSCHPLSSTPRWPHISPLHHQHPLSTPAAEHLPGTLPAPDPAVGWCSL